MDERGRLLHFAVAPNRKARQSSGQDVGPIKQSLVSTRDGTRKWTKEETLRIQCTGDGKQLAHPQNATARSNDPKTKFPDGSTEQYDTANPANPLLRLMNA